MFRASVALGSVNLGLAFRGDGCHANFLQPFQTGLLHNEVCGEAVPGLDNNVFGPTLEATGDAIIEPRTAISASVPLSARSLDFCHHLPSAALCTSLATFSLPRLTVFVILPVRSGRCTDVHNTLC